MAVKCPNCGSASTQTGLSNDQCLECGVRFDQSGVVSAGPDEATRERIAGALAPRTAGVVGNLADLQRAGGLIAKGEGSDLSDGVEPPPNTSFEEIQADAKRVEAASASIDSALADVTAGDKPAKSASKKK